MSSGRAGSPGEPTRTILDIITQSFYFMTKSYYAYVLYSEEFCRYYKGHSTDPYKRLFEHKSGKVKATKPYILWKLVYFEEFKNRKLAIKREKYFKSAAGRRFLKNKL